MAIALSVAAASALACVPEARVDFCERCPSSCAAGRDHCVAEAVADLGGLVSNVVAADGDVLACVGAGVVDPALEAPSTGDLRVVRFDDTVEVLFALSRGQGSCAGLSIDPSGRACVGSASGPGAATVCLRT